MTPPGPGGPGRRQPVGRPTGGRTPARSQSQPRATARAGAPAGSPGRRPSARASARPGPRPAPRPGARPGRTPAGRPAPPRRRTARRLTLPTLRLAPSPRRMTVAFVVVALVFGVFALRLVQLQGLDSSRYATMAASERLREVTLPTTRGPILDTNGVSLATTVDVVNLVADQTQVRNPAAAALQMAGPLGADPAVLQQALTGDDPYVRVERTVDAAVWSQIRQMAIPGIYSEPAAERSYPAGSLAGNLLGFVGGTEAEGDESVVGLAGLEKTYEPLLAGQEGSLRYERDSAGRVIPLAESSRVEPVPGQGLRLTIDRDIQWYVEQALAAKVAEAEAASGSAVVMDPRTGAILAMATSPVLDPTDVSDTPKADLGNRAVEESYEPGSVQKVLTAAALVDAGLASPTDVFSVPDSIQRADRVISDFSPHEDWSITLAGILAQSSNVGTLLAAERMDSATMRDYLVKFGYGRPVGLGLPGETPGLLPEQWSDLQRDTISFGQGVATTIVHLASAYSTIANGGVRQHPYVVESLLDPDGSEHPVDRPEPTRVVSEEAAAATTAMMEAVMGPDGTGRSVVVDGYRLAGKSGTAERVDPECGCYNGYTATFAGFAPADDPRLVVVVSIHDPQRGRYGTQLGGPVFADILSFALPRLGVAPSGTPAPDLPVFVGARAAAQ